MGNVISKIMPGKSTLQNYKSTLSKSIVAFIAVAFYAGRANAQAPVAVVVPPQPQRGTTLIDRLQPQPGDIRTQPKAPRVGAWGLLIGKPEPSAQGAGIQIDKAGQAVVYPTTELLSGATGSIEFSVLATPGADAAANRVLLDSWPVDGNSRLMIALVGTKLTLTYWDPAGAAKAIEGAANWGANTLHKLTVVWSADDLSFLVDGTAVGKIEKPNLPPREPLGLSLGNSRDFQNPAKLAVSDLRLSTARETGNTWSDAALLDANEQLTDDELTLKMAQGYQRRLYPLLEKLRAQNVVEVNFAYAAAYADIGDIDRALQTVTPLVNDPNHPLNLQAVFLRADLLTANGDFNGAYEQLQVLAANKDVATSVRAQVKQAAVLFDQGNKPESLRLLGEIIAKYTDLPDVNEAYLMIGLDRFRSGDFQAAYNALRFMGVPGAPPRQSVAIGAPLEIKVADPDLNVRLTDTGLPVTITSGSGDKEEAVLKTAFSRGVYIGSVETSLGDAKPGDKVLQLIGGDKVQITYKDRVSENAAEQVRTVNIGVATTADLTILAQAALDVYREVKEYQQKNLLDDRWEVVGVLPKKASAFFRNPDTGALRPKGWRFNRAFINNVKPGQPIFVELIEPDEDRTKQADTIKLEVSTQSGKQLPVTATETGPHTGVFTTTIKTTPAGQPVAGSLEVSFNDAVTARYTDPHPAQGTRDPIRLSRVDIRSMKGDIAVGLLGESPEEGQALFMRVSRVSGNNTPITINVEDRDLDTSDAPDKVNVKMQAASGANTTVALTETGAHTGAFTSTIKLSTDDAATTSPALFKVKAGDRITALYVDEENPSGKPENREYNIRANIAENAKITFLRQIVEHPEIPKGATARVIASLPLPKVTWEETTTLVPGSVYRVVLSDPDIVPTKPGEMYTSIALRPTNGSSVVVPLQAVTDSETLEMTFRGEFFARLGDSNSPTRAFFSQTGSVVDIEEDKARGLWSLAAVNLQGKDQVQANYVEPLASDGARNVVRSVQLRVAANGKLSALNLQGNELELLKPGITFELQVEDADGDLTSKRDTLKAALSSSGGDKMNVELSETDIHSGIFSALIKTAPGTAVPTNAVLEVPFAGKVTISYRDEETIVGAAGERSATLVTRELADAEGLVLTKVYDDPKFELETLIRLGESLYAVGGAELATSKTEDDKPRTNVKLQEAARILQQIIERFPTSDYVVESLYLTGKIRREEHKFDEAEKLFTRVIEEYPDSDFVPESHFQLVLLHYSQKDIEKATEAAMRLVYGYPKNPLVADAFLRIAEYYYTNKEYLTAAYIYKRLIDRFPDNPKIELVSYRMATAYYRAGVGGDDAALNHALRYYMEFAESYKDHELADDALYWAANTASKQGNTRRAFTLLTRQLVTYPTGDMKAYATRLRDKIREDNPGIEPEQT